MATATVFCGTFTLESKANDLETYLISLAVALVGGLLLSRLTKLFHLPAVTAYLVAGLILGPFCHLINKSLSS